MEGYKSLTAKPFIRQKELSKLIGTCPKVLSTYLKAKGVELTPFGYSTSEVIEALNLEGFIKTFA